MKMGYQVFVYEGCYTSTKTGRIVDLAGRVLFGGQMFATKAAAKSAWYDTCPERNDRMTIKAVSRA
jgi:hypothetical protein